MLLLSDKRHLQYLALPYLQYAIITYYDLHITLLKELQYNVIT